MSLRLLTPPAVEPLTLAEAKSWLRLETTDEDATVAALIPAARQAVEAASGRRLISQGWRITLDAWPETTVVRLPLAPLAAVTVVRVLAADGTATVLATSAYGADLAGSPPRLLLLAPPPPPGRIAAGIEIDVTAGYGPLATDVPAPLRQAVRLLIGHWFEARGDRANRPIPADMQALVAPFRPGRL